MRPPYETFVIAEVGQAHDGSLGILHSYIDALAKTGVHAVKFQTHIAEAERSLDEPFRVNFSFEDKTRYDYWKRVSFNAEQWAEIKHHCDSIGLEFMSSPFSIAAAQLLENLGMKKFKFGSGEIENFLMLDFVKSKSKEIILSSGLSTFEQIDMAFQNLGNYDKVSLMQCTSSYPVQPEEVGLNVLSEMKSRYQVPIGLSDHSGTIYPSLAAVTLGAKLIEVHAVFDKRMFGPDTSSSLEIDEIKQLCEGITFINKASNNPVDKSLDSKSSLRNVFGKSLALNCDMKVGSKITSDVLESKKPGGMGIPAKRYKEVINKALNKNKAQWAFLKEEDFD